MKSTGTLSMYSIMMLTVVVVVMADDMVVNEQCNMLYSEGSVSKPCTLCGVCVQAWDAGKKTATYKCTKDVYMHMYQRTVTKLPPFIRYYSGGKTICSMKRFCRESTGFKCDFSRPPQSGEEDRVALLSDCKCRCDAKHYGQTCSLTIPPHLSIDSFADVQNIVYVPIIYTTDFATVYVYLYTKGVDLQVDLQTGTQSLRYDAVSCRTDVPRLKDLCGTFFSGGVHDYQEVCEGGPTYAEHTQRSVCAISVNIAFPKDKLSELNEDTFLFDDNDGSKSKSDAKVVAKIEKVSVTIFNRVKHLDKEDQVLSTVFGITVVYRGKSSSSDCPVLVTIPQYSKKSENAPSFPRSQDISLTNLVVLEKVEGCENLGEPITNWFVWAFKVNHDEKNDLPFHQMFHTPTLTFAPYFLEFGKYKVKSTVRFVERNFDEAFAYCYFEIIPIPLQPLIFGGSLRYIYHNSNLDLISDILVDPNYPITAQPNLKRTWNCDDINDRLCDEISGELIVTKYGPFKPGKTYHFTMSVKSPKLPSESYHQTIIVSGDIIPNLLIACLRNCGGTGFKSDTREILYFEVLKSNQSSGEVKETNDYNWTYSKDNISFIDPHDIRQEEETPSWILIVNDHSLQDNKEYTFKVTGGGEKNGEAQIKVFMFKYSEQFRCTVNPKEGIAGQTKFSIECNKADFEQHQHLSLTVYFYDKFKESDDSGRFLGSNYMESIDDVVLTRGTVVIVATNMFGQYQKTNVKVSLTFPELTTEFLDNSIHTLRRLSENEGYSQKLSFISSLCDILVNEPAIKENYTETFLEVINKEDSIDLERLELLLSATQSVICNGNNCSSTKMSERAYSLLSKVLTDVSDKLARELQRTARGHSDFSSSKVQHLYTSFLKCSGVFLSVKNKYLDDDDSVDYNLYNLYKVGNLKILNSLDKVNEGLALRNIPFIKHSTVRTELVETWMKDDDPIYFTHGTKGNYSGSYLNMTRALASSLRKVAKHIVVYVMTFKNNPYWWSQTEDVSTQVVSVSIGYTLDFRTYTPITLLTYPIDIFLKKNDNRYTTVSGFVTQPDADNFLYNKDLAVNVHKIYVHKGDKISLKFINLDKNDTFRVSVTTNLRPDYDMVSVGSEVNYDSPWYHSHRNIKVTQDDDVIFVGILPGQTVPANETRRYEFELQSARCQVWYNFLWDASGCSLGPDSSPEFLHCQCKHLSSLAGFLGVPINTVNPLTDYKLFLTIPENPFVLAFILAILLVYILLLIWSYNSNKRDVLKTDLILLEDNISSDSFPYLVIVFTGARLYAGTTSHIGIILHGSETSSRSHILKTSQRSTLTRDNDDWFLIFSPKHLGTISSVQLWSDHTGTSPNWFCDRVHIHDFSAETDYNFLIGKWFGVTQSETRVESYAKPIVLEKGGHMVDFFLTNIVSGFRESHTWVSVLAKHPRSPMTRAHRVSIAMVALVTALLGCILFYDAAMPEDEDLPEYSVTTREALISLYTMCISVVVTGVVVLAFSKSYTLVHPEARSVKVGKSRRSTYRASSRMHVDSASTLRQNKQTPREFKYYVKKAIMSLRQEQFYPVQARTNRAEDQQIVVHQCRLILAWILCTCIILVFCFFTVWLGLKIGRNKSLLWLTSISMTLAEETVFLDPVKIIFIALLFGMVQTQLCDLYAYDPKIYEIRKSLVTHVERDQHLLKTRLKPLYKPVPVERLEDIQEQQRVVNKWWTLIDILDIVFSAIVTFCIIERSMTNDYFNTNSLFSNIVFQNINPYKSSTPSPAINNVSSYSIYLQDSVFSALYSTHWYNRYPLRGLDESFAETGWIKTLTHRMIGVPRLRQIRVLKKACQLPSAVTNLTIYCNVLYSEDTEDTEYYGAQWKTYTSQYVDVVFDKSPWIYTFPDEVSAYTFANTYSETGELFHGAGYIAQMTRTRRRSVGTLLNLIDLDWLDLRTRVVFFEMSAYNVNNNVFTAIIFAVEHLESSLVLANKSVRSIRVERENALLEVVYFLYSVLVLIKLVMMLNTVGPKTFFTTFWTLYDLCFVTIGFIYCIGFRVVLEILSGHISKFQRSEKEDFFPFSGLLFMESLDRYIMSLLFIFATARSLRLFRYKFSIIHIKHRYTLYFAWPQILCVTFVLLFLMFSYQWLLEYLVNCLYPLGMSHWIQHKMNFRDLQRATVTSNTIIFLYIPCCLSYIGLVFYTLILIESYSRANVMYVKTMHDQTF